MNVIKRCIKAIWPSFDTAVTLLAAVSCVSILLDVSSVKWDTVAVMSWAMLPFLLLLILGGLGRAVIASWPLIDKLLQSKADLNEALMWQSRHEAKAARGK